MSAPTESRPIPTTTEDMHNNDSSNGHRPELARIVPPNDQGLSDCGERLRQGSLVAFPTETVYGLGCHALDPVAIHKVFTAKERPLTDPLIVHVAEVSEALALWHDTADNNMNSAKSSAMTVALKALTDSLWPGPLTIVAKAARHVPPVLMANTGFVACRSPSHALARRLLATARVPLAAPSANKFGHVSPTVAQHVLDDLRYEDVWILDTDGESAPCNVGVESTVAKVELQQDDKSNNNDDTGDDAVAATKPIIRVTVLRQGAVSGRDMEECLRNAGVENVSVGSLRKTTPDHVATVAPGQTIRHYSPNVPSFLVSIGLGRESLSNDETTNKHTLEALQTSVVIDFGQRLLSWKDAALEYRDLAPDGSSHEAAKELFDVLRWAETVPGSTRILFPFLDPNEESVDVKDEALFLAVKDRLTRAASGVVIDTLR